MNCNKMLKMKKYLVLCGVAILCLLEMTANAQTTLPVPENSRAEAYQREIVLKWKSSPIEGIQWEVVVDDQTPLVAKQNKYIVTGLTPDTEYVIKVRAVKGGEYSDFVTVNETKTKPLSRGVEDVRRIPYLWTLATRSNRWGTISKSENIGLFYNDLAVKDAKITYKIDGESVVPQGNYLIMEKAGKQQLTITIEETKDRVWTLMYNLKVIE